MNYQLELLYLIIRRGAFMSIFDGLMGNASQHNNLTVEKN